MQVAEVAGGEDLVHEDVSDVGMGLNSTVGISEKQLSSKVAMCFSFEIIV